MAGSNEEIPHGSQPVESGIVLGPSSSQNPNSQPPILETAIGNGNGTEPQQAAVNDDQIDAAVAGSGPALPFGAKRPLKSNVWLHFIRFLDKNNEMKARCKYCKKVLGGDTNNGTTHLRNHTTRCIQRQLHDGTQKNIKTNFLPKGVLGKKELCSGQYNAEVARKDLATMIVMHEYPLGMVDHLYFKIFCASLQPLFKVPCRNTLKRDILATYDVERKKIQKGIDSNKGRIAVTTDMWTATNQKRGYMAITGHYIDNGGKLRNHLLSFPYVPAPHTSAKLATVLRECLMDWNVDMHMRCSAHVLNLIVKDGLDIIKEDIDFELYLSRKKRAKPSSVNSELDHYLNEDVIPRSRDIEFDILGWWRANAAKYPTLHEIARDILVVPITSVASESAFSSGGRLLDPHRSRLHFKTVEALMCTRSWIKDGICRGLIFETLNCRIELMENWRLISVI
ncbi:Zinc finger BED domain-containing protein RICESLEEPER 2 [Linum grandiflorum]